MQINLNTDLIARDIEARLVAADAVIKMARAKISDIEVIKGYNAAVSVYAVSQVVILCYDIQPAVKSGVEAKDYERWRKWQHAAGELIAVYEDEFEFGYEADEEPAPVKPVKQDGRKTAAIGDRSTITDSQVIEIRQLFDSGTTLTEIQRAYGIASSTAYRIAHRISRKNVK